MNCEAPPLLDKCYQLLEKTGSNVVWEILRQSEKFYHWQHYPKEDVIDKETNAQYYYHAHANQSSQRWEEHGHFHLFMRNDGIPKHIKPSLIQSNQTDVKTDPLCHVCAISMDKFGKPLRLFTTNRWVTAETWYNAEDIIQFLPHFAITHAWPSWPTNIWITQMVQLHLKEIGELLLERDRVVNAWQEKHPDRNVLEDRELEITSSLKL